MRAIAAAAMSLLLLADSPQALIAQTARVTGKTHMQGDSSRFVPNAEVTLLPEGRVTRSDSTGGFFFAGVADGSHRLHIRRLGFEESDFDFQVTKQNNRELLVPLSANAQALREVVIAGKRVMYPARYAEPYERMAHGDGDYFTREKIESMHPIDMQTLMVSIPGVTANGRLRFQRCDDSLNPFVTASNRNNQAKVQVYVDGTRVTNYNTGDDSHDASHELRDIVPTSLQLVEVYRGVARIPARYLDDACAVILLWTK